MSRVETDEAFRKRVCAWLRANGVDPAATPMEARASVTDGVLTILQKVQVDGCDVLDPEDPTRILTRTAQFPVVAKPDFEIEQWLMPRCPECWR